MARRIHTLVVFGLVAGVALGTMAAARSRMEAEAAPKPGAAHATAPAPAAGTPATSTPAPSTKPSTKPSTEPSNEASMRPPSDEPTRTGKVVYLTFDDGPDPRWTPQVLDLLQRYDARGTFFMLGDEVRANPGLVRRVRDAGHAIGNHSVDHKDLTKVSAARLRTEIAGGPASRCFRPPYGATNARVRAAIRAAGLRQVLWDVDPDDWQRPGARVIASRILTHVHNGDVVLMHDGGGNR
ncbi:MAG TPA: polysaccharide deacetylase family protein, partial [Kribbellaceae bacterium]|nr:polysaccharide deacetylase family protein [Kribbellaceae bacterium]